MHHIETRVARLEADLNSQKPQYIGGIWLVGVSLDGSSRLGEFLPIGCTDAERRKNRAAAYEDAELSWVPTDN